jgi:4-hydroxybenzoate polyprenyltransferase
VAKSAIRNYLSLVKFSHTVFAMPFAVIGYSLGIFHAGQSFDSWLFLKILVCMITARTAAMAFNRYSDRMFDAKNERTRGREIPGGIVSPGSALTLVILSSVAFVITTWYINRICFFLSPVALAIVLGYSYTKRFTWLCHVILGIGLSLAPIGAYLAVTGEFAMLPVLFSLSVICWVSGFDIIYALQDEEFDKSNRLYSMPAMFGKKKSIGISAALHAMSASCIIAAGFTGQFGWIYWTGACLFVFLLIYQHSLIRPDDLSKINLAFFTLNGIASMVFAVFVILDLFL